MNIRTIFLNASAVSVCIMVINGCSRADVLIDPEAWRDRSLPGASEVFAQKDAADRARIAALPVAPVVATAAEVVPPVKGKVMTTAEEVKSMPMPGQNNDHSSTPKKK